MLLAKRAGWIEILDSSPELLLTQDERALGPLLHQAQDDLQAIVGSSIHNFGEVLMGSEYSFKRFFFAHPATSQDTTESNY